MKRRCTPSLWTKSWRARSTSSRKPMKGQANFQSKHATANVLRETWLLYKHKHITKDANQIRAHQRNLLLAINEFVLFVRTTSMLSCRLRKSKTDRIILEENSFSVSDTAKVTAIFMLSRDILSLQTTNSSNELIYDMIDWRKGVDERLASMQLQMYNIQAQFAMISHILSAD